jgi:hypothetical protein
MILDLSGEEAAALTKELADITGSDRYPFSERIRTLRAILSPSQPASLRPRRGSMRRPEPTEGDDVVRPMGEAKRLRQQFRKTPTCVFCGGIATTRDHVPPRNLFIPPRPRLITVPACETCNGSTSAFEDEFRVYVGVKDGPDTPEWFEFWRKGGHRAVHQNDRLRRNLSNLGLYARSPFGGYGQTFRWPRENHHKVIEKITRGLYYHHFSETLEPTLPFEITFLNEVNADLRQTILSMRCCNVG